MKLEEFVNAGILKCESFCRDFMVAVKNGDLLKIQRIWWQANWSFVLISVLLASLIYFFCLPNIRHEGRRQIQIKLVVDEKNAEDKAQYAYRVEPWYVDVVVWGTDNDVKKFESLSDPVIIKVSHTDFDLKDNLKKQIKRQNIPGVKGAALKTSFKPEVTVFCDKIEDDILTELDFFIDPPKLEGRPYHGDVDKVEVVPSSVKAAGRRNVLNALKDELRLKVEPVNVDGLEKDFDDYCNIIIPDAFKDNSIELSTNKVRVLIFYKSRTGAVTFKNIPVRLSMPPGVFLPEGCRVEPLSVSARLTGYDASVQAISNSMVFAYAEILDQAHFDNKSGATNSLPVRLLVPHDREIWSVEANPDMVRLIMPSSSSSVKIIEPVEKNSVASSNITDVTGIDVEQAELKSDSNAGEGSKDEINSNEK